MRARYAISTAGRRTSTMRRFAAALCEAGVRGAEEAAAPPRPPLRDLTPDELEAALRPPGPPYAAEELRDHSIVTLIHATGLRVGEIEDLDVGDLRLDPGPPLVRVRSGASRALALDLAAETAAERYLERARPSLADEGGEDALYVDRRWGSAARRGCMNRQLCSRALRRYADGRGIEAGLTAKALRRAYVQAQLEAGMDPDRLRRRLGLKTRKQARAYAVPSAAAGGPARTAVGAVRRFLRLRPRSGPGASRRSRRCRVRAGGGPPRLRYR